MATQLANDLAERMALLAAAAFAAGLPMPGVARSSVEPAWSPRYLALITEVSERLPMAPRLARAVQITVFRHQELVKVLGWLALRPMPPSNALIESLRSKLYYLANLAPVFADEPLLADLFSPPQTRAFDRPRMAQALGVARSRTGDLREARALADLFERAQRLHDSLANPMGTVRQVLADLDGGVAMKFGLVFSPAARTAKLLALELYGKPEAVTRMRQALGQYDRLKSLLTERHAADISAALQAVLIPLGELSVTFKTPPGLRDLFARTG